MESPNPKPIHKSTSSIFNIPTNTVAALLYCIPALFAWIPIVGYFSWIIPMWVFMTERKSNYVRFCASQSLFIGIIRLIFGVVFDGIYNVAVRTTALYGQNPEFAAWWGDLSNPGGLAHTLSIAFALFFTALCLYCAVPAYRKKLIRLPIAGKVADFMTKELKPVSRHSNYSTSDKK